MTQLPLSESFNTTDYEKLRKLIHELDEINDAADDATWILTSAFIIFTMQSGFGLLEAGSVSKKNESNIMMKNAIDVVCGGFSYWLYGYAFTSLVTKILSEFSVTVDNFVT